VILIAHRGNLHGPNPQEENKPEYIQSAIDAGYDVEVDVWLLDDKFYLGHDFPEHEVELKQLERWRNRAWFHAKNLDVLNGMVWFCGGFNIFWHETDKFSLTSKGFIWTYPGEAVTPNSIIVQLGRPNKFLEGKVRGICTDYAAEYEER